MGWTAVMVAKLNPHFEFRLLKEYPRFGQKEPDRKMHSTLSNKPDNQQMTEETSPYEGRSGRNCMSDPGFDVQQSELEKHRRKDHEETVTQAEALGVQKRGIRDYRQKQHFGETVTEAEALGVQISGIRDYRQKEHYVLIVSRETLVVIFGQIKNLLELCYVMKLSIRFKAYDGGLRISCSNCNDKKIMTEAGYKMLMMQTVTRSLPVSEPLTCSASESMQSYCQVWHAKKKYEISFPWFCFDRFLSSKGTEGFFNTNPVAGEGYLYLNIETLLCTLLSKMKQVCLVFEENDTDKNIVRVREYLETVLGITVIDIHHSFDAGKTEIENINECISTSEYFIFIPTRGETSPNLKYKLNLIVSELFNSSGQNNILTLTDSTQNICNIPPLLWPFPIFICNFEHNWVRPLSPVFNENDPQINTNCKMINRVSRKGKASKAVRIISGDIEKGELIKKSILLKSPTTTVTVNDDDVPCGALLYYEYAARLYTDQLFVVVPSRERSSESEYALRVIFSRLNQELDTLRIQSSENMTAIDGCTQSYTR